MSILETKRSGAGMYYVDRRRPNTYDLFTSYWPDR